MKSFSAILLSAGLLLSGCDSPTEPPSPKTNEPHSTVFDSQIKAMDKAKQVEGQMQQDAASRQQQVDQASH